MRIALTGSSGLIGSALVAALHRSGHDVVRLVRRVPTSPDEVRWDPRSGDVDLAGLAGIDAAVNLAGAGIGDHRWTDAYKREIRDSRVSATGSIARTLAKLEPRPSVLVSAAAMGFYGDRGEELLTEESGPGGDFLAGVVRDWEAAAEPARRAGIRVVTTRSGLVLTPAGGALQPLLRLFRLGLGGRLGSGRQWWSWITLPDEVAAITMLLERNLAGSKDLTGPVNLTSPNPVRNSEFTAALGAALRRPTLFPAPALALRVALGEFSSEVLSSHRVLPSRLTAAGFAFQHPTMESAMAWATGH